MDIIDLFNNKNISLLKIELFQNLFDKNVIFNNDKNYSKKKKRRNELLSLFF